MAGTYDDPRWGSVKTIHAGTGRAANTSVIPTRVEIDRKTMFGNVTIKDWNIQVIDGDTSTGTQNSGRWNIAISKSLAGAGAVTPFGSAVIGTAADGSVADATLTETNFSAGDDLVVSYEVGTALPAATLKVEADVSLVERYVGS